MKNFTEICKLYSIYESVEKCFKVQFTLHVLYRRSNATSLRRDEAFLIFNF